MKSKGLNAPPTQLFFILITLKIVIKKNHNRNYLYNTVTALDSMRYYCYFMLQMWKQRHREIKGLP